MLIERILYARLSSDPSIGALVHDQFAPTKAKINSELPHIKYTITTDPTESNLDGVCSLERHTLTVDTFARTASEVDQIMSAVKTNLHGYRGGQIQWCSKSGYSTPESDKGYQGQQTYSVWQDNAVISSTILFTRGSDEVVTLRNLTNQTTGLLVNNAVVTGVIFEEDESTQVYTFSLPYTGTSGRYQGAVPSATTATMTDNTYRLRVTAVAASTEVFWATIRMR